MDYCCRFDFRPGFGGFVLRGRGFDRLKYCDLLLKPDFLIDLDLGCRDDYLRNSDFPLHSGPLPSFGFLLLIACLWRWNFPRYFALFLNLVSPRDFVLRLHSVDHWCSDFQKCLRFGYYFAYQWFRGFQLNFYHRMKFVLLNRSDLRQYPGCPGSLDWAKVFLLVDWSLADLAGFRPGSVRYLYRSFPMHFCFATKFALVKRFGFRRNSGCPDFLDLLKIVHLVDRGLAGLAGLGLLCPDLVRQG